MQYKNRRKINKIKKVLRIFKPTRKRIFVLVFILIAAAAAFGGYIWASTFKQQIAVPNDAMEPAYKMNDIVTINKAAYLFKKPQRGDIIYLRITNEEEERTYIRRVIGVPGDTIEILEGVLYINESETELVTGNILDAGIAAGGVKLETDQYFVMGDNYNMCEDSRYVSFGLISTSQIIGRIDQ
ncbi:MAG: signal peptidase I [Lachnospiraceae bacterium]|nr:signal peptidase I [Lachnospiraceae bacterium]